MDEYAEQQPSEADSLRLTKGFLSFGFMGRNSHPQSLRYWVELSSFVFDEEDDEEDDEDEEEDDDEEDDEEEDKEEDNGEDDEPLAGPSTIRIHNRRAPSGVLVVTGKGDPSLHPRTQ